MKRFIKMRNAYAALFLLTSYAASAEVISGPFKDKAECAAFATLAGYDNRISSEQKWGMYESSLRSFDEMRPNLRGSVRFISEYNYEMNVAAIRATDMVIAIKGKRESAAVKLWNQNDCSSK
ncbi:hypothetical protein AB5J03_004465 [Yersinia enterocolitica]|uniref:hypothetical protein n=1 Tax=Enterobacterales TaxID=91347 RepID=UPI00103B1EA3|nr:MULTISPECIES: hypothetical protein [Enterobacterales]ECS3778081.1 hypothetical protein [Salmonella enterica]ELI8440462.1 hypothetical protein [Yersinia enterocolitica]ELM8125584.1 hypothetical protein [Escherichia coli]ELM8149605.1 hypothetical protein [Escherichia coli]MBA1128697.1 hypothetical protein [Escherichia coli]